MTTPRPTLFPATTPRTGVLVPFVIISDSDDKITTLPVRPAPPSSDRIPALHGYPLEFGDDSSDEDLSETAESLRTQTALTLVVHPPSTRPLPTSPAFARRPGKKILMPLGYRAAIDRWRAAPPSTCHPLLPSELPSSPIPRDSYLWNFSGTEGAVGLTRWFEKLESVFRVSKVEDGDNVKYTTCTMLDGALTWWNLYVRIVGIDAANAIPWSKFKQMLIKKYSPRSEVQKMETELWNLKVRRLLITRGSGKEIITTTTTTTTRINVMKWPRFTQLGQLIRVSMLETYPTAIFSAGLDDDKLLPRIAFGWRETVVLLRTLDALGRVRDEIITNDAENLRLLAILGCMADFGALYLSHAQNVHDTKEILNDAESQVKMKEKQFQVNYENINSLYDTFVPQTELSLEQEYFSDPYTSNVSSESSLEKLDVLNKNMPNESKLLTPFGNLDKEIKKLGNFNIDLEMD
ncbi:hypothetical protein Tco_1105572 [Tanacetum coccineum]